MEEGRRNLMVGVFVLLGLGTLALLSVLIGRAPTWLISGKTYPLHVHFDQVTGIREGNLVTIKGITIGRVDRVAFFALAPAEPTPAPAQAGGARVIGQQTGVDVVLGIERDYLIPKGSAAITTEPMLGQGRPPVEIIPGPADAEPLPAGASIPGTMRSAIDTIFPSGVVTTFDTTARQIGDAAEALTPVLEELKVIFEPRTPRAVDQAGGPQGNLSSAVARFDAALKHFNEVLGDPQVKSQLRDTIANVDEMSVKGKKVMDDLQTAAADARDLMADGRKMVARADETLTNLDHQVTDVSRATLDGLDRADRFLDYLNIVGEQVTTGKGNLGQFVMDNRLYEALTFTAERLSLAVEEFRGLVAEWRLGKVKVAF